MLIGKLLAKLGIDTGEYTKGLDAAERKTKTSVASIGKKLASLGGKAIVGGLVAGAIAIGAIGIASFKLASDAAPIQGVTDAFYGLAEAAGTGGPAMLEALQTGSAGLVDNTSLMKTFNEAAQLVGQDFAVKLPDAMGFLGKVSQATGQDMGFMIDSLVKGVGRLSPMILDNLGIQVTLADATANAAAQFGIEAGELDKSQIQAGMMNVVLEKLAINTAAMPDVAGSAAQAFGAVGVTFKNLKDDIGLKLLPVFVPLMEKFGAFAQRVLPQVVEWIENVINVARPLIDYFTALAADGWNVNSLFLMLPDSIKPTVEVLTDLYLWLSENLPAAWQSFRDALQPVIDFIKANWEPIVVGLVTFLLAFLIPAFVSWALAAGAAAVATIAALAPVVVPIMLIAAVVALLYKAWQTNFMGIRDTLTAVWEDTLKPIFILVKEWLEVNIPAAIDILKDFWDNVLLPAIQRVWSWIQGTLFPLLETLWAWLGETIPVVLERLSDFWENVLLPAITMVWDFIINDVVPLLEVLWELLEVAGGLAIEGLVYFWEEKLLPSLTLIWEFIQDHVVPILETLWEWIGEKLGPVAEEVAGGALVKIKTAIDDVKKAIGWLVDKIKLAIDWLNKLKTPKDLTGESPSPFETSLIGIGAAFDDLTRRKLPAFNAATLATAPMVSTSRTVQNYNTYQFPGSGFTPESEESIVDRMKLFHLTMGESR